MPERLWVGVGVVLAAWLPSCGADGPRKIERTRHSSSALPPVRSDATEEWKYGWAPSPEEARRAQQTPLPPPPAPPPFAFELPEGWERQPETMFRQINTRVAAAPDAQCYLTWLPGDGGGDVNNVNRWRDQVGLPPIDQAAVDALPRIRLLGAQALRVDVTGSFVGMGGERIEDARILGALLTRPAGGALFVKFVGPSAVIEENVGAFERFVASIHLGQAAAHAAPDPNRDVQEGDAPAGDAPGRFAWTVPEGWTVERAPRAMREVTLTRGEAEMYVSITDSGPGRLVANVDRWLGQLGAKRLDEEAVARLPRIPCLGGEAIVVEAAGDLTAMDGTRKPDQRLLGALVEHGGRIVSVKLVGPAAEIAGERAAFESFVRSLEERR